MDGLPSHEEWFGIHITHKNGLKKEIQNQNLSNLFSICSKHNLRRNLNFESVFLKVKGSNEKKKKEEGEERKVVLSKNNI